MSEKEWRPLRGNLLSSLRDRALLRVSTKGFNQAQGALDSLGGVNADLGFFHRDDGSKVYTCTIRLLSGSLAFGTGATLAAAAVAARKNPPIQRREAA